MISRDEWEREGWKDDDLDFTQQDLAKQKAIRNDFHKYFEAFGEFFLVMHLAEPHPPMGSPEYFEPLMEPVFRKGNLTCFIEGFLTEHSRTFVFHLGQECFVSFGFDMSVYIYHKTDLPQIGGLEVLQLAEI